MVDLIADALHKEVRLQLDPAQPYRFERRAQTFLLLRYLNEMSDRPEVIPHMYKSGVTSLIFTVLSATQRDEVLDDVHQLVDLTIRVLSERQSAETSLDYRLVLSSFHKLIQHLTSLFTEAPLDAIDCINEILVLSCLVVNNADSHDAFYSTGLIHQYLDLAVPEYSKDIMNMMKRCRVEQAFETKMLCIQIITTLASGDSRCVGSVLEVSDMCENYYGRPYIMMYLVRY